MKNLDIKKLLVFIILIVAVIGGIIFVVVRNKSNEKSEKETEINEKLAITYFANLTQGYSSPYAGIDVLYNNDKTTIDDLEYGAIINTAIKYAQDNDIYLGVSESVLNVIEKNGQYGKMKNYVAYNGQELRNTIKLLFGEEAVDGTYENSIVYQYDFIYVETNDVYLMKKNENVMDYTDTNYYIDYTLIKNENKKDTLKTTIAIAYVHNDNGTYTYYSDSKNTKEVAKDTKEFPEDKVNEFTKYTITLKKKDNNYVFESIEKVK